ncbi:hypothetical protein [Geopseudomonas aromaticivorans]
MDFAHIDQSGTVSLAVTTPMRASCMYPVRPLLEMLCDRVTAGVTHGTVQFALILSHEAHQLLLERTGGSFKLLSRAVHIGQKQAAELRKMAPILNALPPDEDVPEHLLKSLTLPLPCFLPRHGYLTLAEAMFGYGSSRNGESVKGFTGLCLDLDLHKFLYSATDREDLFGLRYIAAAAWNNIEEEDWLYPDELFEYKPPGPGNPGNTLGVVSYSTKHPLAGSDLYEIRHRRKTLTPTYEAKRALYRAQKHSNWSAEYEVQRACAIYIVGLLTDANLAPSCVTLSGRGLHLRWRFSEFVPAGAWRRVRGAQKALHGLLMPFGSDPQVVTDRSRVYRVPGQINERVDRKVERYRRQSAFRYYGLDLGRSQTLDYWCNRVMLNTRSEWRELQEAAIEAGVQPDALPDIPLPGRSPKEIADGIRREEVRNIRIDTLRRIGDTRVDALLKLADLRGGIFEGERNIFMFCAAQLIRSVLPERERDARFLAFEDALVSPLPDREIRGLRNGLFLVPKRPTYISNAYICEMLGVSEEELEALPALRPRERSAAPWKRMSRQLLLAHLLRAGTAPRVIESVMGYSNPRSVYALTSRLYANGTLRRADVLSARAEWMRLSPPQVHVAWVRRKWLADTGRQAKVEAPAMVWLADELDAPGRPRAGPADERVLGPISQALSRIQDIARQRASSEYRRQECA